MMLHAKLQRVSLSLLVLASLTGCASHLSKATDALAVGDEQTAEEHLRKALKSSSTQAEAGRQLSVLLTEQGNKLASTKPRDAENLYSEALELDPTNEEARLGIARLLLKRGFVADARELLSFEGCRTCGRLLALIVHDEAVKHFEAGELELARQKFQEALDLGGDPLDAIAIARAWLYEPTPDLVQAKNALAAAAPLCSRGQVQPETEFRELRTYLLLAAAAARQPQLVEELLNIRTPSLAEEPEFELRFRVSQEQFRAGDSNEAIERIASLLANSGQYIDPTQREVMSAALILMYSGRAAQYLQAGEVAGAAQDIAAAKALEPNGTRWQLQQVLAIAANGRLDLAFTTLDEFEKNNKSADAPKVRAILHATEAIGLLEGGNAVKAQVALDKAEALDRELPEVHLARAYLMAELRNEDLKTKELQEARNLSAFSYPGGRINQYAGALAHIDRARALLAKQGTLHPWRGPRFEPLLSALEQKLKGFYPYEVRWYEGKGGLLEIASEGGQKDVQVTGPRWLKVTAIASPGNTAEVEVPNVGLVVLDVDGKQIGVVIETNAHVKVGL